MAEGTGSTAPPADPRPALPHGRTEAEQSELLLEESTANEQTIALWRLAFCLVGAVQVVLRVSFDATPGYGDWVRQVCAFLGVLYSAALFVVASRKVYGALLSCVSVGMDVTLITGGLLCVAVSGDRLFATNNNVAVPLYLLAIALAGLRYNPALTVFATLLTIIEYSGVVWYCVATGDLYNLDAPDVARQRLVFGQFDLVAQMTSLVLIIGGGLVATFGVRRARALRTASILDPLTQVYNRGFFDARYHHEFARAERYDRSLAVAVLDVDRFKLYNDRLGHAAGDQVLCEVADTLLLGIRSTDTVARYGGEEFIVLLPETGKAQAVALVARLLQQTAAHSFVGAETQPGGALTLSAGVAAFPEDARSPQDLFHCADAALYRAKAAGRNRVTAWEAATEPHGSEGLTAE